MFSQKDRAGEKLSGGSTRAHTHTHDSEEGGERERDFDYWGSPRIAVLHSHARAQTHTAVGEGVL